MSRGRPAAVVVLAAGEGTRMKSATPKVLHPIGGRTPARPRRSPPPGPLEPEHLVVVVGHERDAGRRAPAPSVDPGRASSPSRTSSQGHRPRRRSARSRPCPATSTAPSLVTYGDVPLLTRRDAARARRAHHAARGSAVTVLTADVADPTGYGRIVRDADGARRRRSSSRRTPTDEQRAIREINSGIYAFDAAVLRDALAAGRHRQRPGRAVPHRRRRPSPARTAGRVGAHAHRRRAGRPRASTTASSSPRSARELQPPHRRALDARRRHRRRPGDHLDRRRRRRSRPTSRSCPAPSCTARPRSRRGRRRRPGHAR